MLADGVGQPAGERHATALDADEDESVGAGLLLDDLVGNAHNRAADLVGGHDPAAVHGRRSPPLVLPLAAAAAARGRTLGSSFPASQGRSLKVSGRIPRARCQ